MTASPLRQALAETSRVLWDSVNPTIPHDVTIEDVRRGSASGPDYRFRLHPEDEAARAGAGRKVA